MKSYSGFKDILKDIDFVKVLNNIWEASKWFIIFTIAVFLATIAVKLFRFFIMLNLIKDFGIK